MFSRHCSRYKHRDLMRNKVVLVFSSRSYSSGRETDNQHNKWFKYWWVQWRSEVQKDGVWPRRRVQGLGKSSLDWVLGKIFQGGDILRSRWREASLRKSFLSRVKSKWRGHHLGLSLGYQGQESVAEGRWMGDELYSSCDENLLCMFWTGFFEAVKLSSKLYFKRFLWPLSMEWSVKELVLE